MIPWVYDEIGNIISRGTDEYSYGSKPHAATGVTNLSYVYDANGNMTSRGSQTIAWDVENRPRTVNGSASFVYDGDGMRVKKTEGGQTVLYVNRYYEKNLSTGEVATYYYLGDRMTAKRAGSTLTYLHQDSLGSTSVVTNTSGAKVASSRYYPYGGTWSASGALPAQRFTGQRLDETGLYYLQRPLLRRQPGPLHQRGQHRPQPGRSPGPQPLLVGGRPGFRQV